MVLDIFALVVIALLIGEQQLVGGPLLLVGGLGRAIGPDGVIPVRTWSESSPTSFCGVNTLFNGLLHTPGFDEIDFSPLKITMGGGAPVQQAVSEKWQALTGHYIKEGYGLSETSPILTLNLLTETAYRAGIGVPDEATGEAVRLFVAKSDDSITVDDIRNFCRSRLTRYKVPKQVVFMDELPKSSVGKILRQELR